MSFAPTKPIVIGGLGLQVTGPAAFTGGVLTRTGGRLRAYHDYPTCNTRSRTIFVPIVECGVRADPTSQTGGSQREDSFLTSVLSGGGLYGMSFSADTLVAMINVPRRYTHNTSRIASVRLNFVILAQPAAVPSSPPSISVFAFPITATGEVGLSPIIPTILWASSTTYTAGQLIAPLAHVNGYYYECSVGGVSSSTEPNPWTPGIGSNVTDGGVTWTCVGYDGRYPRYGATPASYFAGGAGQTLEYSTFGTGSGANVVATPANSYVIQLGYPDPAMLVTGVTFNYDTITALVPE
jgi:hypothetical protein